MSRHAAMPQRDTTPRDAGVNKILASAGVTSRVTPGDAPGSECHQKIYFPGDILEEIAAEAARQRRSFGWLIRAAWKMSRSRIAEFPAAPLIPYCAEPACDHPKCIHGETGFCPVCGKHCGVAR